MGSMDPSTICDEIPLYQLERWVIWCLLSKYRK